MYTIVRPDINEIGEMDTGVGRREMGVGRSGRGERWAWGEVGVGRSGKGRGQEEKTERGEN